MQQQIQLSLLIAYPQDSQSTLQRAFPIHIMLLADIWIADSIHIRGYADLDISRMFVAV
jgi:hypothetical protein